MQSNRPHLPSLIKVMASRKANTVADSEQVSETVRLEKEAAKQEEPFSSYERAQWFEQRAGDMAGSAELFKYLSSAQQAENMFETPRNILTQVAEHLAVKVASGSSMVEEIRVILEEATAEGPRVEEMPRPFPASPLPDLFHFGVFGPRFVLSESEVPALLALHIAPGTFSGLNLEAGAFFRCHPDGKFIGIIEASDFFPEDNMLVAYAGRPGTYSAVALPSDSRLRGVVKVLADNWSSFSDEVLTIIRDSIPPKSSSISDEVLTIIRDSIPPKSSSIKGVIQKLFLEAPETHSLVAFRSTDETAEILLWSLERFISDFEQAGNHVFEMENTVPVRVSLPAFLGLEQFSNLHATTWKFVGPKVNPNCFEGIGRVTQIDVHPRDENIVVAATGGGVWRTDNGGKNWLPLMHNEPTLTMGAVAFAPSNPDYIYAASGEDAGPSSITLQGSGVYQSKEGGKNWKLVAKVTSTRFSAIVVHPEDHLTIYVAGNRGLHKSKDGGETWIINPGCLSLFDGQVTDVVIAHDDPERIYIGVFNHGVLRSKTAGEARGGADAFELLSIDKNLQARRVGWPKLAIGRGGNLGSKLLAARLDTGISVPDARVYITRDGGDNWTPDSNSTAAAKTELIEWEGYVAVHPQHDNILIVGAGKMVQKVSIGRPAPIQPIGQGAGFKFHEDQQDIAFDPNHPDSFYVANDGGVYYSPSTDKGFWEFASGDLHITQVYDIDISEKDPNFIVCGTQDNGVFFRTDGITNTWKQFGHTDVVQVAIDPANPKIFYFANKQAIPEQSGGCRFVRSTDGGLTQTSLECAGITGGGSPFVTIMKLHPDPTLADPEANREMFICGFYHLFYSTDAGRSFRRVEDEKHQPFVPEGEISALEYSAKNPSVLYLGTRTGRIYKTVNGGRGLASWERFNNRLDNAPVGTISIDPNHPHHIWVGLSGNGVSKKSYRVVVNNPYGVSHLFKLGQDGNEWIDASGKDISSCLSYAPISSIVIDDKNPDIVYVTSDVGVFRTSDGGDSWHSFQKGLPRTLVTKLKLNRSTRHLVVGTMGRGIYWRHLPG